MFGISNYLTIAVSYKFPFNDDKATATLYLLSVAFYSL